MVDRKNVVIFIFTTQPRLRFLLLKRTPERSGYWQPVTGGIKPRESDKEAALREIREETGIIDYLRFIDLQHTFRYHEPKGGVLMYMQDYCYALEIEKEMDIRLSEEHEQYVWVDEEGVRQKMDWDNGLAAFEKLTQIIKLTKTGG